MPLLTILAEGARFALLGDETGRIIPMPRAELAKLSGEYARPILVPAPGDDAPKAGGYKMVHLPQLPPDLILYPKYYTEPLSRITIYYAFYQGRYIVRELRGEDGKGNGKYHREG